MPQQLEAIDINDLSLTSEEVEFDPQAEAFAFPPPPPEGDHLAVLLLGPQGFKRGTAKDGRPFITAYIEARIQAPGERWDDRPVFDNFVDTLISPFSGTCRMVGVLKALGRTVEARTKALELARALHAALLSQSQVSITVKWRGYCQNCGGETMKGARQFPATADGGHRAVGECPTCKGEVAAQARIVAYKPSNAGITPGGASSAASFDDVPF